jgi:hypothetical protein
VRKSKTSNIPMMMESKNRTLVSFQISFDHRSAFDFWMACFACTIFPFNSLLLLPYLHFFVSRYLHSWYFFYHMTIYSELIAISCLDILFCHSSLLVNFLNKLPGHVFRVVLCEIFFIHFYLYPFVGISSSSPCEFLLGIF